MNLARLLRRHLEEIERAPELGRDLVELRGRNPKVAMGLLQAQGCAAWVRSGESDGSARDVTHPQGAHEFWARQPAEVVGVPFSKGGSPRPEERNS